MTGLPLKGMHKKSLAQKILAINDNYADRQVAMMVADRHLELTDRPYRFSIDHDIRPPGLKPCPLSHYDWSKKDRVGIDTPDSAIARRWLTSAVLKGYTVSRVDATYNSIGFASSLAIARRRAAEHQRPKVDNDDDIPF